MYYIFIITYFDSLKKNGILQQNIEKLLDEKKMWIIYKNNLESQLKYEVQCL